MQLLQAAESLWPSLVDVAIKGTVLLVLSCGLTRGLRHSSAAVRHRLWGLTMIGLLLLPALSWRLPHWRLPVLPAVATSAVATPPISNSTNPSETVAQVEVRETVQSNAAEPTIDPEELNPFNSFEPVESPRQAANSQPIPGIELSKDATKPLAPTVTSSIATLGWRSAVAGAWCVGTLFCLSSLMVAAWRITRFTRESHPIADSALRLLAVDLRQRLQLRRDVALREHPQTIVPLTCGLLRPIVLLPRAAQSWPDDMRRAVLLHELAHVQRGDVAWQWLARLTCALYWFHPLAWLGLRQMRLERELACDDAVVLAGELASDYAQQLLEVARRCRKSAGMRPFVLALSVEMTNGGKLEQRVRALFDSARSHGPLHVRLGVTLLLGASLLISLVAVVRPVRKVAVKVATAAGDSNSVPAAQPLVDGSDLAPDEIAIAPITGTVVFDDGRPARGARVVLRRRNWPGSALDEDPIILPEKRDQLSIGADLATAEADEQGRFAFHGVKATRQYDDQDEIDVDVVASYTGRALNWQHVSGPASVKMNLHEEAKLSGRVIDSEGNPVAGAEIRPGWTMSIRHITQADLEEGRWPSSRDRFFLGMLNGKSSALAVTNAMGEFTLGGLPAGVGFRLRVSSPRFASIWFDAATLKELDAETLRKTKRPVATGNLVIALKERRYPFTVRVVDDATGELISNVTLSKRSNRQESPTVLRVNLEQPSGVFELSKLPPRIDILAEAPIGQGYLSAWRTFAPENDPSGEIRLIRGKRVEGRVVDAETGEGIPNVQIRTGAEGHDSFARKIPRISVTDQMGQCVALLPAAGYGLVISGEVPGYMTYSKANGQREPIYQNVMVDEGAATPPFEFRLPRSRRIEGDVVDAAGRALGGISYHGAFRIGDRPKLDVEATGGSGPAGFHGQSGADGRIMISEPFNRRDAVDTLPIDIVFFDKRRRLVGQLLVDPRRPIEPVRVVMQPAGRISGRVVDETGRPQTNALVEGSVSGRSAAERMSRRVATRVRTGMDGRFDLFSGMPDRQIDVFASLAGFDQHYAAVRLDSTTTDHDLGDIVLRRPTKKSPELLAPVPDAAGLAGAKAVEKLTTDYETFRHKLLEARQSAEGWPTVPNSSTLAFARELLRVTDDSHDVNPDKTVQAIACYEAAESQLAPRGYDGKGGLPDPGAIEKAIPLLERVVQDYAETEHPWRGSRLGDLAAGWLFDIRQLQRGATVPELEWKDIDGKPVRLADFRGKVVVIDCCSIGSGSALGETEHSRRLLKQAGSEQTATITVLYDDLDQARKNLEKFSNPAVLIAGDEAVRFFRLWNVQGWPTAFIIDVQGNLRAKRIRGTVIAEVLTELLDQPPLRESNK